MAINIPVPDKYKPWLGSALVILSFAPQVLFGIGAFYPPAAVWAVAVQDVLGFLGHTQPALGQGIALALGGRILRESEPTPAMVQLRLNREAAIKEVNVKTETKI